MPPFPHYYGGSNVSRVIDPADYSLDSVVFSTRKPLTDADLNLIETAREYERSSGGAPSGFFLSDEAGDAAADFVYYDAGDATNRLGLRRVIARVAGRRIEVNRTGTSTDGINFIDLGPTSPATGSSPETKPSQFVYLEVWRSYLRPAPRATGAVTVVSPSVVADGNTFTLNAAAVGGPSRTFTARTSPATALEFAIGGSVTATASALAARISDPANGLLPYVRASAGTSGAVNLRSVVGGTAGNGVTLATSAPSAFTLSGATFAGGAASTGILSGDRVPIHGNVLAPIGAAKPDGMIDPELGIETSSRIQVRYALRVRSIDAKASPDGFSDANVWTSNLDDDSGTHYPYVPADGTTVSGASSAAAYGFRDGGLWIAGDGSSDAAEDLETVDGFRYALPVAAVYRLNDASETGGFDPFGNANGGLSALHEGSTNSNLPGGPYSTPAGKSDRPDGRFHDVIVPENVLDLRRHLTSRSPEGEATRQLHALLDGKNRSWASDASDLGSVGNGSGGVSATPLMCATIGRGTTTVGTKIRSFDHIARRFSSAPVLERVVFSFLPSTSVTGLSVTKAGGTSAWHAGDRLSIDFDALEASSLSGWGSPDLAGRKVSAAWPEGTRVTNVLSAYHDDGHSTAPVSQDVQFLRIEGIGTNLLHFYLDANGLTVNGGGTVSAHPLVGEGADNGSLRRIFIELEITYPSGSGLPYTPIEEVAVPDSGSGYGPYEGGPIVEITPTQRTSEAREDTYPAPLFRPGVREVALSFEGSSGGARVSDTLVTLNSTTVRLPRRLATLTGALANGFAPSAGRVRRSSPTLTLAGGHTVSGQVAVAVSYWPFDPIPDAGDGAGYSVGIYYRTLGPQTVGTRAGSIPSSILPTSIEVAPVSGATNLYAGSVGAGSPSVAGAYPYPNGLERIPTALLSENFPTDSIFSGANPIYVGEFGMSTGFVRVSPIVELDANGPYTFGNEDLGRGPVLDAEGRVYYDLVNPGGYQPLVLGAPLGAPATHKTFLAMLVKSRTASRAWTAGETLLLVVSRFNFFDPAVQFAFNDDSNPRTVAALYRTKNLLTFGK